MATLNFSLQRIPYPHSTIFSREYTPVMQKNCIRDCWVKTIIHQPRCIWKALLPKMTIDLFCRLWMFPDFFSKSILKETPSLHLLNQKQRSQEASHKITYSFTANDTTDGYLNFVPFFGLLTRLVFIPDNIDLKQ